MLWGGLAAGRAAARPPAVWRGGCAPLSRRSQPPPPAACGFSSSGGSVAYSFPEKSLLCKSFSEALLCFIFRVILAAFLRRVLLDCGAPRAKREGLRGVRRRIAMRKSPARLQARAMVPKWFLLLLLDIQCSMSYNK